ncbi:MAG: hypothetical protein EP349_02705 [Alphaproteobacteria bacterium]|nr:MAG: hypothetical protein EP349_02705 [Alphaproteobacteria bacterium]
MKKFLAFILILAAIGGGVYFYMGTMLKPMVEKVASHALGTKVTLAALDVSIAEKKVTVKGIQINNPQGAFQSPYFLHADTVSVTARDLTGAVLALGEIVVDGVDIRYEVRKGGTNLGALQDNIKAGQSGGSASSGGKDLVIDRLQLSNISVTPLAAVAKISGQGSAKIPDIVLKNIGSDKKPATAEQVLTQVMDRLARSTMKVVTEKGLGDTFFKGVRSITDGAAGTIPESDMDQRMDKARDLMKGVLGH